MSAEIETPAAPAATAPTADLKTSFDASFPDDGLDTPPEAPVREAAVENPPERKSPDTSTSSAKSKETDSSKGATSADASAASKTSTGKADSSSADDAEAPTDFTPPQVGSSKDLKAWATRVGKWAQKMTSKAATLENELKQARSQPPKQAEDTANLSKELAAAKKQLEEYEHNLRLTKYERSNEYREKYQRPYETAIARANKEVKELIAYEPNPEDPENPRERAATEADFAEIYNLPLGQATKLARARFGDAATIMLQHRQNIRQLAESAYQAVEEYRAKGGEEEQRTKAEAAQRETAMGQMFEKAREGHAKRAPKLFMERDGDEEGNALLAKGRDFAASVFGGSEGLTAPQVSFRDAMAYNRLSCYPRLVRDVKKLESDLAEAQKTIESLRSSSPGPAKAGGEKKSEDSSKLSALEAFDREVPA